MILVWARSHHMGLLNLRSFPGCGRGRQIYRQMVKERLWALKREKEEATSQGMCGL